MAGAEAWHIYCCWRYGNEDPYRLYNGPDTQPPPFPERVQSFVYGCGQVAMEREIELAGGKITKRTGMG